MEEKDFLLLFRLFLEDLILKLENIELCWFLSLDSPKKSVIHRTRGFWPLITIYEAQITSKHTHGMKLLQKILELW